MSPSCQDEWALKQNNPQNNKQKYQQKIAFHLKTLKL